MGADRIFRRGRRWVAAASAGSRWRLKAIVLSTCVAGCSGGLFVGFGESDFDDRPGVSLVASVPAAAPGQPVRLAAATSDDGIVISVQFLRLESDGAVTALGTDLDPPWERDTTMPATTAAEVHFFARATDNTGQRADSATVAVRVIR